ncbi:MAG: glycosyltransferase family 39 protein [Planctomycetota bacterium]
MMLLLLALVRLLIHLFSTGLSDQGFHRTELVLLACGERLSAGYLEFPPLTPWLARIAGTLSGHELILFRAFPALAGALSVLMAGIIARQLGGGRFAQGAAALALLIAPGSLLQGSLFSMGVFDTLLFCVGTSALLAAVQQDRPRWWLLFGAAMGLSLLNHYTNLLPFTVLLLALCVTSARARLRNRFFLLGCLIALALLLPNILWQIQRGFPSLEFVQTAAMNRRIEVPVSAFLLGVVYVFHPLLVLVWVAGLCWLLFPGRAGVLRSLGWVFLISCAVLIVVQSTRPIRLQLLAPVLYAAGAIVLESVARSRRLRVATILLLVLGGLATLPLSVPGLTLERAGRYAARLGLPTVTAQHLGERVGWREMAENVEQACNKLTQEERSHSAILAGNSGEAGAIELFLADRQMPEVLCGHNSFYGFGAVALASGGSPEAAIAIGWPSFHLHSLFEEVKAVGLHRMPQASPVERDLPIFLCRRPRVSLASYWERVQTCFDDNRLD